MYSQVPEKNIVLDEIELISKISYDSKKYFFYKNKVIKVYHYVDTLKNIISEIDDTLLTVSKKRLKKKVIKGYKKQLMERFVNDVKSMTRKEGVILSKLVFREFGFSVYDIIKNYNGAWSAFWWQNLARLYEGDIKSNFNPKNNKEDFMIEKIIIDYIE